MTRLTLGAAVSGTGAALMLIACIFTLLWGLSVNARRSCETYRTDWYHHTAQECLIADVLEQSAALPVGGTTLPGWAVGTFTAILGGSLMYWGTRILRRKRREMVRRGWIAVLLIAAGATCQCLGALLLVVLAAHRTETVTGSDRLIGAFAAAAAEFGPVSGLILVGFITLVAGLILLFLSKSRQGM